ncbi:MAG: hypothetical protein ACYS5F_03630 [Planctomycetota bacterium]
MNLLGTDDTAEINSIMFCFGEPEPIQHINHIRINRFARTITKPAIMPTKCSVKMNAIPIPIPIRHQRHEPKLTGFRGD